MRLHSLTLSAIGPFPGSHTIDFERLAAGGLFLLEGPTGAGKSTVIDAVVFALYGRVASSSASQDRLTSRHAAPGTTPFVDLVFETSGGVYRVRRSPEHMRPKQRGTGFVKEHAQVRLWRLADPSVLDGHPMSTRVGEADAELLRILGLSREQFVQTVVLPQGEFATFLRAAPEDRRLVLQQLFGTEIYQRMQERLAEAAKVARRAAEGARAGARSAIDAFVLAGRSPAVTTSRAAVRQQAEETALPEEASPDDVDLLSDRLDQLAQMAEHPEEEKVRALAREVEGAFVARAAELDRAEHAARRTERVARCAYEAARDLAERLATRSRLLREQASLDARSEETATARRQLETARRATGVLPGIRAARHAADVARAARAELDLLRASAGTGPDTDMVDPATDLAAVLAETQRSLGGLEPALQAERSLEARAADRDELRLAVAGGESRAAEICADIATRAERRRALDVALDALRERSSRADVCSVLLGHAEHRLQAAEQMEQLAAEEARVRALVAERAAAARGDVDRLTDLRRRRIADIAGELAESLAPGEPCSVCGALEHPAPAERREAVVRDVDLEEAERACSRADVLLSAARDAANDVASRLHAARTACEGRAPDAVRQEVEVLRVQLAEARAAGREVPEAERALSDFDATTETLRERLSQVRDDAAGARERLAVAEEELARLVRTVADARGRWPSVGARVAALRTRADLAGRIQQAVDALTVAESGERGHADAVARALAEAGFGSSDEVLTSALEEAEMVRIDDAVQEYRSSRERVTRLLAEPDLASLTGEEEADVEAAAAALEAASTAHLGAARAAERARAELTGVRRAGETLGTALALEAAAASRAEPVRRMAELATGGEGNDRRHTLAAFVLLHRFEEVLDAANVRLAVMSDGRYELGRTDEREGGVSARKAGLGLVVHDLHVGDDRAARTLSGGETFYVSLCLALGLADVVQAEAGGVDLGTLFIDEGFGSLDPETLDTVLRELGRLRSAGRAVGIVSHVEELKRRIPERIEVRRRSDGSSDLAVVA